MTQLTRPLQDQLPGHGSGIKALATVAFVWYLFIVGLSIVGALVVWAKNTRVPKATKLPSSSSSQQQRQSKSDEGVTVLRPLKGIDHEMEACLSSALEQDYETFEIIFSVESADDPAVEVAKDLITRYPHVDAKLVVSGEYYGPNPKINNLARGYNEAKYDILWVLDSNVWVSPGTMARSVARFHANPRIQLVHHLPLCVSIDGVSWGSKLDEMFMLSSHSKFYTAINFVGIAPCVMGKSNLYRRSALDAAVAAARLGTSHETSKSMQKTAEAAGTGIRTFAQYIAEDNMIAQCIWDNGGRTAMTSDSVVQPLGHVSLEGYWSRRVRWLRVRRYMVWAATMIEPTTESLCCAIYGTFAISVLFLEGVRYWSWLWFVVHMVSWCLIDYWHYHNLMSFGNIDADQERRPKFVQPYFNPYSSSSSSRSETASGYEMRSVQRWLPTWVMREVLAMPIWVAAMSGQTIYWRNRPFRILHDLSTKEINQ